MAAGDGGAAEKSHRRGGTGLLLERNAARAPLRRRGAIRKVTRQRDVPQDAIVHAAGHVMGLEKLSAAAEKADAAGDIWLGGRLWAVATMLAYRTIDQGASKPALNKSMEAITKCLASPLHQVVKSSTLERRNLKANVSDSNRPPLCRGSGVSLCAHAKMQ